jgi:hypothetical protein
MVGALGVVEDEPIGEFAVEEGEVGEEQVLVVVHEGLLDRAVEALGVGVHLRRFGVGVPAADAAFGEEPGEVAFELAAVVGKQDLGGLGQQGQGQIQRAGGVPGVLGGHRHGEGEVGNRIGEGDEVAAYPIADALAGRAGQHLQGPGRGLLGFSGLCLPPQGLRSPPAVDAAGSLAHLVGSAGDDAPYGGDAGQRDAVLGAPGGEQHVELGLAEVWVERAQAADLVDQARIGLGGSLPLGGRGFCRQGGGVATLGLERGLPAVERAAGDVEGVAGRCQAVLLEGPKNLEASLSIFGRHVPKMPQSGDLVTPPDPVSHVLHSHGTPPQSSECQRFLSFRTGEARSSANSAAY